MGSREKQHHQANSPTKEEDDQACIQAMLLSSFQVFPGILNAAIELNLFDIISQSTPSGDYISATEIASHLPKQHPELINKLDRILRALASFYVLNCSTRTKEDGKIERLYGLSLVGKYFVRNETENVASFTNLVCYPALARVWLNMKEVILDSEIDLFDKVHGMSIWEYMDKDPKLQQTFVKASASISTIHMRKYLEVYNGFEGISTLVDVGGGVGHILNMVISKYPSIKGINFDLPQVIQHAPPYPGIEHVGGDMYESVPKGDAIMIKTTCHNWPDEKCVELLKNCYKALPQNGKVIILDFIMPEEPKSTDSSRLISIADCCMFQTNGKERSEKEFEKLCKDAGFSSFGVASRVLSILGVMECYK